MSDYEAQFLNLPSHLINDILSRLSTRTIVQCKSVCKTWLNLLSESEFINLHLPKSPPGLIVQRLDSGLSDSSYFSLVEFEDEPDHHDFRCVARHEIKHPKFSTEIYLSLTMVGSINGLICLNGFNRQHDTVYLWNPSTREFITLPKHKGVRSDRIIVSYGFGLSSQTGQYKVVRFFQVLEKSTSQRILTSSSDVYTLGEGNQGLGLWRRIEHAPFVDCFRAHGKHAPYVGSFRAHGIFLNANLHWLINYQDGRQSISCFDLEKELFLSFPAPPELSKNSILITLGVFAGCLSLCDNTPRDEIVIWVMKEYGITKPWSKEIVIDKKPVNQESQSFFFDIVRVLKVFKDGNMLLLLGRDILLSYDSRRKALHEYIVDTLISDQIDEESYPRIKAIEHVSSFLSFKNFGIEMVESIDE